MVILAPEVPALSMNALACCSTLACLANGIFMSPLVGFRQRWSSRLQGPILEADILLKVRFDSLGIILPF
jgi:hypothetical protein